MYRRGTGSSIQGKILRDNVGKLPWAAGTAYNLPGTLSNEAKCRSRKRAQREWHMSRRSDDRGVTPSEEMALTSLQRR